MSKTLDEVLDDMPAERRERIERAARLRIEAEAERLRQEEACDVVANRRLARFEVGSKAIRKHAGLMKRLKEMGD